MTLCSPLKHGECFASVGAGPHQPLADLVIFSVVSSFAVLCACCHLTNLTLLLSYLGPPIAPFGAFPMRLCLLRGSSPRSQDTSLPASSKGMTPGCESTSAQLQPSHLSSQIRQTRLTVLIHLRLLPEIQESLPSLCAHFYSQIQNPGAHYPCSHSKCF